jgi:molybdopterin/thiamine biosynthesis adenylyltransferase
MKKIPYRFIRNIGILTEEEQNRLFTSTVSIVGMGCTGCAILEFLARSGVSSFTLIDGDRFEETNINRQLYAKSSTIGQFKVEAAKEAVLDINPNADVTAHPYFLESENDRKIFESSDLIVNGVDDPFSMVVLHRIAKTLSKPSIFLLSGVIPFQGICSAISAKGDIDYETFMGIPIPKKSLDPPQEVKKKLFEKINNDRALSGLRRGAIPGNWVRERIKGGWAPSFGITSNITSLIAANEAIKVLINRTGLSPVYAPDLIYFDGATCNMSIKRAEPGKFWYQGDF